jgi:NADH-quinone oxidoreductase subunit C
MTSHDNSIGVGAAELMAALRQLAGIDEISQDEFFVYLQVDVSRLVSVMRSLLNDWGMNYLANLSAVDYDSEFEVVYHLYAIPDNGKKIAVKVRVPHQQAQVPSLVTVFPTADWQEREAFDLMGISFSGHPNLVRILLPDDFSGHPLRKDFRKEA